jgi:hypothetical protein
MTDFDEYLDTPGYGALWVAGVLNLRDENGDLDERRAYYILERGYADADKIGRVWTSTPRRLLNRHLKNIPTLEHESSVLQKPGTPKMAAGQFVSEVSTAPSPRHSQGALHNALQYPSGPYRSSHHRSRRTRR